MPDLLHLALKLYYILILHTVYHEHGKRAHSEILHHDVLPFHCLNVLGKIREYIIINSGIDIPKCSGNQQQYADDQNQYPVLYHLFPEIYHLLLLPFILTVFHYDHWSFLTISTIHQK